MHSSNSDSQNALEALTPPAKASSRVRFENYRQQAQSGALPRGSVHSSTPARGRKDRVRPAKELIFRFFGLLSPFRWQIVTILSSLTVATLLALIPPAGTKFLVDYVLSSEPLPEWLASRYPSLTNPKNLLTTTSTVVVTISLMKIALHIWGRW